jgi:hypothetical protein
MILGAVPITGIEETGLWELCKPTAEFRETVALSCQVPNRVHNSAITKWPSLSLLALLQWTRLARAQIAVNPVTNKLYVGNQTLP